MPAILKPEARARAWIELLERDPSWTVRMREELDTGAMPGDLVLLLANTKNYPNATRLAPTAERTVRVGDWLAIVASVDEVSRVTVPITDRDGLCAREPRDQAHALLLAGLSALAFRFRVPPSPG